MLTILTFRFNTMLQPWIVGEEHYEIAQGVKQTEQRDKELKHIIAIPGPDQKKIVSL